MKNLALKEKFCDAVADRLLEYIVKEALAINIARAVYDDVVRKYIQKSRRERIRQFELWNEKFRLLYERNLIKRFNEMEREVLGNIKYLYGTYNKSGRIEFDVDQWLFNRQKWRGTLTEDGKVLAAAPIEAGGRHALDDLNIGMSFDQLDPRVIEWVATNSKNAGWSIADTQYEKLRTNLMEGIADGESIPKIRNRVAEIFNASRARATLIARTETLKASNRGGLIGMLQSGVVQGKQWLCAVDKRTCPQCEAMDGATMPLGDAYFAQGEETELAGFPMKFDYEEIQHPPLHPDCRCTLLAIFRNVNFKTQVKAIADRAAKAEPGITRGMKRIAKRAGASLNKLEYRLKRVTSINRKFISLAQENPGKTLKQVAEGIKDAVRYTSVMPEEDFAFNVVKMHKQLEAGGYRLEKVSNYFGKKGAYQGINAKYIDPQSGLSFEMQYHTKKSVQIVDKNHKKYEIFRVAKDQEKKMRLNKEMIKNWEGFNMPEGADTLFKAGVW